MPAGTNEAGTNSYSVIEYDARMYGYIWSFVYAAQVFARLFDPLRGGKGLFSAEAGARLRRSLYEQGASTDAHSQLRHALGDDQQLQSHALESFAHYFISNGNGSSSSAI